MSINSNWLSRHSSLFHENTCQRSQKYDFVELTYKRILLKATVRHALIRVIRYGVIVEMPVQVTLGPEARDGLLPNRYFFRRTRMGWLGHPWYRAIEEAAAIAAEELG